MSTAASAPLMGDEAGGVERAAIQEVAQFWWLSLITGCLWIVAALVVLQFDQASVTTVGVIVGLMFAFAAVQQFILAAVADRLRWLWIIFGVLFGGAAIVCFVNPKNTFAGIADILGFLFLTVGIWWVIRAFIADHSGAAFWLGLISGVLMIILAFWTSGQFFIQKAYTLLVFAGIWALMHGITDIARAFAVRSLRE
jgi:uncharacterized membrane protein HdeD (DUF308 family)